MGIILPTIEDFTQSSGTINFGFLNQIYEAVIDEAFVGMSRTILLHLSPQVEPDPVSFGNGPTAFNPFFNQTVIPSENTKVHGVKVTTRDIPFSAMIVIGPRDFDDTKGIGRLEEDEAHTTTVIESHGYIASCLTATIDGLRYRLVGGPRTIGFKFKTYVLAKWQRIMERNADDVNSNT